MPTPTAGGPRARTARRRHRRVCRVGARRPAAPSRPRASTPSASCSTSAGVDVVSDPAGRLEPDYLRCAVAPGPKVAGGHLARSGPACRFRSARHHGDRGGPAYWRGAEPWPPASPPSGSCSTPAPSPRRRRRRGAGCSRGGRPLRRPRLSRPVHCARRRHASQRQPLPPLAGPGPRRRHRRAGDEPRTDGAAAAITLAIVGGIRVVRTPDVREARRVGDVVGAILRARVQP